MSEGCPQQPAGGFAPRYMTQGGELRDRVGGIYLCVVGSESPSPLRDSFFFLSLFPPGGALSVVCARVGWDGRGGAGAAGEGREEKEGEKERMREGKRF